MSDQTAATTSAAPTAAPKPNPLEVIRSRKTMGDALLVAGPLMVDKPNESNLGSLLFASWSVDHLRWTDVNVEAHDETSYAAIQKDIDTERMKRLCATGQIIEIRAEKTDVGKWYTGLMFNMSRDLFHFHAVRSTEGVLKGVTARFCGVVTGWFDYKNSGGGTGHAVEVVGMFSLAENRAAK